MTHDTQVVGYKYHIGLHFAPCYGPVDELTEILAGERSVWSGSVSSNETIRIDKPEIFGGEKQGGGIQGDVDVLMGEQTQQKPSYLRQKIGELIPAYRGILSIIAKQVYIGTSPSPRPWWFRVRRTQQRTDGGARWYSSKASIERGNTGRYDMNPAHIIQECLTDHTWGMGYPHGDLDDAEFKAAADTLYNEGFGISILWQKQSSLHDFIQEILNMVDGALFLDPSSGQIVFRLVRQVSAPAASFDENNADLEDFSREGWGETTNQVTIKYTIPETGKERPYTVQNLANTEIQGGVVSQTLSYTGITKGHLAAQVASRELTQLSRPLAKGRLLTNRDGYKVRIGDVVEMSWSDLGFSNLWLRVTSAEYGSIDEGRCIFEVTEDIFEESTQLYSDPAPTNWTEPNTDPALPRDQDVWPMPFHYVAELAGHSTALNRGSDEAFVVAAAARSGTAINYEAELAVNGGAFEEMIGGDEFTPWGELQSLMDKTQTTFTLQSGAQELNQVEVTGADEVVVGTEAMVVDGIDVALGEVTVRRGTLDTVPQDHSPGESVWFRSVEYAYQAAIYSPSDSVKFRARPTTSFGTLAEANAESVSLNLDPRHFRPYPPGRLRVHGLIYPIEADGPAELSWAHRDRSASEDGGHDHSLVGTEHGSIGPESGTTYTVRIYNEVGTLVRTVAGVTGTSYQYPTADELSDGGPWTTITWELEASRDGYASWQYHQHTLDVYGYGRRYGQAYGGLA